MFGQARRGGGTTTTERPDRRTQEISKITGFVVGALKVPEFQSWGRRVNLTVVMGHAHIVSLGKSHGCDTRVRLCGGCYSRVLGSLLRTMLACKSRVCCAVLTSYLDPFFLPGDRPFTHLRCRYCCCCDNSTSIIRRVGGSSLFRSRSVLCDFICCVVYNPPSPPYPVALCTPPD